MTSEPLLDPVDRERGYWRRGSIMGTMSRRQRLAVVGSVALAAAVAGASPVLAASNDPLLPQQWALAQIHADQAWVRSTGAGITIGIVDTGVDLSHEDLAAKVTASANCVGSRGAESGCHGNGQDDNGHGTHVSGIAAAAAGNGRGIAGVAPGAGLVVAKALASDGSGNTADVAAGIRWVVHHGARVVNLSLGDVLPISALQDPDFTAAVEWAWSNGAIPVIAAGNSTFATSADYDTLHAVVVAASGPRDSTPLYSSSVGNARWGIAAPGGEGSPLGGDATTDVLSTYWKAGKNNDYGAEAGTSMAAPHVTGALALVLAQGLSPTAAVDRILSGADRFECGANCHGRLNAAAAVGAPSVTSSTSVTAPLTSRPPSRVPAPTAPSAPAAAQRPSSTTTLMPAGSVVPGAAGSSSPNTTATAVAAGPPQPIAGSQARSDGRGHGRDIAAVIAGVLVVGAVAVAATARRRSAHDSTRRL